MKNAPDSTSESQNYLPDCSSIPTQDAKHPTSSAYQQLLVIVAVTTVAIVAIAIIVESNLEGVGHYCITDWIIADSSALLITIVIIIVINYNNDYGSCEDLATTATVATITTAEAIVVRDSVTIRYRVIQCLTQGYRC